MRRERLINERSDARLVSRCLQIIVVVYSIIDNVYLSAHFSAALSQVRLDPRQDSYSRYYVSPRGAFGMLAVVRNDIEYFSRSFPVVIKTIRIMDLNNYYAISCRIWGAVNENTIK